MLCFRPTTVRVFVIFPLALSPLATMAFGQPPAQGIYTYRYGYNPGYYGSSTVPRGHGTKPGQAATAGSGL